MDPQIVCSFIVHPSLTSPLPSARGRCIGSVWSDSYSPHTSIFCSSPLLLSSFNLTLSLPTFPSNLSKGCIILIQRLNSICLVFLTLEVIYKLQLTHMHYNLCKHFFSNGIVSVWNSLPNIVVSAESTNIFKIVWIN